MGKCSFSNSHVYYIGAAWGGKSLNCRAPPAAPLPSLTLRCPKLGKLEHHLPESVMPASQTIPLTPHYKKSPFSKGYVWRAVLHNVKWSLWQREGCPQVVEWIPKRDLPLK